MTRIIGGSAKGRRLVVPAGGGTRPTSSHAREALLSSLEAELGSWDGRSVLDLYCGGGAVGLEAASRGARTVVLVDDDRRAWHAARENVALLAMSGVLVHRADVVSFLRQQEPQAFDVVFADPPYAYDDAALGDVLALLPSHGWLAGGAVVVVERASRGPVLRWPPGLEATRSRRYGDARLWYGRPVVPDVPDAGRA